MQLILIQLCGFGCVTFQQPITRRIYIGTLLSQMGNDLSIGRKGRSSKLKVGKGRGKNDKCEFVDE